MLLTSSVVLFMTSTAYFIYEYISFKKSLIYQTTVLGQMVAANTTAALAFGNGPDAEEVLSTLKVNPNILSAVLYDADDSAFATYPENLQVGIHKNVKPARGFSFAEGKLEGVIPVILEGKQVGTLYLASNMDAFYARFRLYALIAFGVIAVSLIVSYLLSRTLQKNLSKPILSLAETAKIISNKKDYNIRATRFDNDEIGTLTSAFNNMLSEIEKQNAQIIALNQNLEAKVRDRTQELEIAYNELEAYSYTVSHDLNAPLRKIDMFIDQYQAKGNAVMDEDGRRTFERIVANTRKMRQLIADLLAFSQLGKKELVKSDVNMKEMVQKILDEQEHLDGKRTIQYKLCDIPNAIADESTLNQVWANFISNALKYSKNNAVSNIEICFKDAGASVIYYIKDNGVGFDMKHYDKLFSAFQRLHTQREFDGTGVGLAIVQRIITRHGGEVWAESAPDQGATFYFSLPKDPNSREV